MWIRMAKIQMSSISMARSLKDKFLGTIVKKVLSRSGKLARAFQIRT